MPEIPDLEAIRGFLAPRIAGRPVAAVEAPIPWIVRTGAGALEGLVGRRITAIARTGKFLRFEIDDGRVLVVNPMLTGRFQWVAPSTRRAARTALVIAFAGADEELRYVDQRQMGRIYLVAGDALHDVPQMDRLGPDALAVSEDDFLALMRRRRGQVKNVITNQEVIAGIGNAYADEILWEAGLHPHRTRSTMDDDDLRRLYAAMRSTLAWATAIVEEAAQSEGLGAKEEWRQHLRVHRRSGEPCPRCGNAIRAQSRGDSETGYCVTCQPLFR